MSKLPSNRQLEMDLECNFITRRKILILFVAYLEFNRTKHFSFHLVLNDNYELQRGQCESEA